MMPAFYEQKRPVLYDVVVLAEDVQVNGTIYRAGTRGQIVESHERGVFFEVEFTSPFAIATLPSVALLLA